MGDITISTEPRTEEKKVDVREVMSAAIEAEKIEKENDRLRKAISDQEELRAKLAMGGRSYAGQPNPPEKTPSQIAADEAAAILKTRL